MSTRTPKEYPALFTAPMVRKIGTGEKTQTRRMVQGGPSMQHHGKLLGEWPLSKNLGLVNGQWKFQLQIDVDDSRVFTLRSPHGQPGDRIYVRETFALEDCGSDGNRIIWRDDRAAAWESSPTDIFWLASDYKPKCGWSPSIHMPRRFARYLLDVTAVRIERLPDISEEDARAEGFASVAEFRETWIALYGAESWNANPYVWVTTFKLVTP